MAELRAVFLVATPVGQVNKVKVVDDTSSITTMVGEIAHKLLRFDADQVTPVTSYPDPRDFAVLLRIVGAVFESGLRPDQEAAIRRALPHLEVTRK